MPKLRIEFDIDCDEGQCGRCKFLLTYPGGFSVCRCVHLNPEGHIGDLPLVVAAGKAHRHPLCIVAENKMDLR